MEYPSWLQDLLTWLKRLLGQEADRPSIRILEEYHADGISVLRIEDPSVLGCVSLWRIDRHHESIKFFICIINLSKLREELAARKLSLNAWSDPRAGGLAGNMREQLQEQADILATHYWITGWNRDYHGIDKNGRAYHSHRLHDVRLLACDFSELPGIFPSDRYAKFFARAIVKRLGANDFREFHQHRTWQAAVRAIDWKEWLSGMAATHIDQTHILQPKRSKSSANRSSSRRISE